MKIRVLGSAAGGAFPQWNCGCDNCRDVRRGEPHLRARSEESIAVSADDRNWFVVNVAPDVRRQFEGFSPLQPKARRGSPVAGFFLTNGDLDHCLGLLSLRESERLTVYTTDAIFRGFSENNALYRTLRRFPDQITWRPLALGDRILLTGKDGSQSGLSVEAIAAPGKLPIHLDDGRAPDPSDNIALSFRDESTGNILVYAPAIARPSGAVDAALDAAECVFFDGTFWTEDELVARGLGEKRAVDMAHWPLAGQNGSLSYLSKKPARRKVLIHINNTNPVLREDSAEAREVRALGIDVAWDGMEVET